MSARLLELEPAEEIRLLRDSSPLLGDGPGLRNELAASGSIFLPGLLAGPVVRAAFDRVGELLLAAGWAKSLWAGRLLASPECAPLTASLSGSRAMQRELFALEVLHRLVHCKELLAVMADVLDDDDVLRHPRPAPRVAFPTRYGGAPPTATHQDHLGMQGAIDTYTAWIALAECSRSDGPLAVASRSHLVGLRPYRPQAGSLVFACDEADLAGSWESADFAPGDVVIFHSLTVHRALENAGDHLRLSVDCRYQRASDPICEVALRDQPDLLWSSLYRDWETRDLCRYWQVRVQQVVPFDASYVADLRSSPTTHEFTGHRDAQEQGLQSPQNNHKLGRVGGLAAPQRAARLPE